MASSIGKLIEDFMIYPYSLGSKYFERTLDWEWKQFEDESTSNVSFVRFESDGNVSSESKEYSDTLTIASYLFRKPYFDRLSVLMHFKRVSSWVHLCTESRITTSSRPVKRNVYFALMSLREIRQPLSKRLFRPLFKLDSQWLRNNPVLSLRFSIR